MKKVIGVILALSMVLAFTACETTGLGATGGRQGGAAVSQQSTGIPAWVRDARRNAPEDALVGIGSAKMSTVNQSMNVSETRARAQIVRAMNSMVSNMITDYTVSSELDPSAAIAFQEEITKSLAQARLTGARIVDQDADDTGTWWTVVYLSKTDVVREINQAQTAAKLAVPAALAFDAAARMEQELATAAATDWVGNN